MKVLKVSQLTTEHKRVSKHNNTFKSAASVSKEMAKMGISTNFRNNDFFAECAKKVVELFNNLFGKYALPKRISYEPLGKGIYGSYYPMLREIEFNSNESGMYSQEGLKRLAKEGHHFLLPDDFSTTHPAATHVHEFSHCAHHANLDRNHSNGALIMDKLRHTQVPTAIGKLITKFKLGNYALDKAGGMNEFMAERMSQDICNGILDYSWSKFKDIDVNYSNIFGRKWSYRYSSPQAYLDYYTQQVWNGNIEEAKKAAGKIETYLAELEASKVPNVVAELAGKETSKKSFFGSLITSLSEAFTEKLDERNKLIIRY